MREGFPGRSRPRAGTSKSGRPSRRYVSLVLRRSLTGAMWHTRSRVLGVEPKRCWYVGDSSWDMIAARAAGMVAMGVTAGSAVRAGDLTSAGAVKVCKTLRGVIQLIGREPSGIARVESEP